MFPLRADGLKVFLLVQFLWIVGHVLSQMKQAVGETFEHCFTFPSRSNRLQQIGWKTRNEHKSFYFRFKNNFIIWIFRNSVQIFLEGLVAIQPTYVFVEYLLLAFIFSVPRSSYWIILVINKVEAILRHNNVCVLLVEHEGAWRVDKRWCNGLHEGGGMWACVRWDFHSEWFLFPLPFFTHLEKSLFFDDRSIRENEKIWTHMLFLPSSFGTRWWTGRSQHDQLTRSLCLTNLNLQWLLLRFVKQRDLLNWLSCFTVQIRPINRNMGKMQTPCYTPHTLYISQLNPYIISDALHSVVLYAIYIPCIDTLYVHYIASVPIIFYVFHAIYYIKCSAC